MLGLTYVCLFQKVLLLSGLVPGLDLVQLKEARFETIRATLRSV